MLLKKIRPALSFIFLISQSIVYAAENDTPNLLQQDIQFLTTHQLWNHDEWLNLLHYQPDGFSGGYLSQVDDSAFFYSENGKHNPQQEMIETLKQIYQPPGNHPDSHAKCRFIARYHWLKNKLPDRLSNTSNIQCPEYENWRKNVPENKVSLIFPAYHLNSPSSMFGHTLLRIDAADEEKGSTLLSMAVNFGATIDIEDNSLLFAVKGLFGGYYGNFIVTPYYKKIKEYNRHENRDIWEYALNLTAAETLRIVEHLWELKDINFDYYFFDENCSYRLLELLEVARPGLDLKSQFGLTAIPVDTVRSIQQAGLINGIEYRPSQTTNINALLKKMTTKQQQQVHQLTTHADYMDHPDFTSEPTESQMMILDTAYRYLRYQQNEQGRSESNARNSYRILNRINQYTNFVSSAATYQAQQQPEMGHLSKRLAIAIGEYRTEAFLDLRFRMSFHDLEDNINGFLEGAQINMGSLSLRMTKDEAQIQQLDFIDIFSLTPRNAFFQPLSWKVYTGLEQQWIHGKQHLTGHVTAGAGVTYDTWRHGYIYGLITARLETNSQFDAAITPAAGFSTGLLHHFSSSTVHLNISGEEFNNDEHRHRIDFKYNFVISRNHSMALRWLRQRQPDTLFSQLELAYQYYFH